MDCIVNDGKMNIAVFMHDLIAQALDGPPGDSGVLRLERVCQFVGIFRDLYQAEQNGIQQDFVFLQLLLRKPVGVCEDKGQVGDDSFQIIRIPFLLSIDLDPILQNFVDKCGIVLQLCKIQHIHFFL